MTEEQSPKYIGETEKNLTKSREGELDHWLKTVEAAELSGYHPDHIKRLLRAEKIQGRKWGQAWMINRESLLAYIQIVDKKGEKRGPKGNNPIA